MHKLSDHIVPAWIQKRAHFSPWGGKSCRSKLMFVTLSCLNEKKSIVFFLLEEDILLLRADFCQNTSKDDAEYKHWVWETIMHTNLSVKKFRGAENSTGRNTVSNIQRRGGRKLSVYELLLTSANLCFDSFVQNEQTNQTCLCLVPVCLASNMTWGPVSVLTDDDQNEFSLNELPVSVNEHKKQQSRMTSSIRLNQSMTACP